MTSVLLVLGLPPVPFAQLYTFASAGDLAKVVIACFCAAVSGASAYRSIVSTWFSAAGSGTKACGCAILARARGARGGAGKVGLVRFLGV